MVHFQVGKNRIFVNKSGDMVEKWANFFEKQLQRSDFMCFSGVLNDQISNLGRTEVLWNFVNRSGDMAEIMANFFGKQFQMSDFIRVFSVY